MAANVWNGMTYTNIARRGFDYYLAALNNVFDFSTDFSSDVASQGTAVSTRIVPAPNAAQDLSSDLSGDYSAATDGQTTTAITVNLNKHPITGFNFTDSEMNSISNDVWSDTAMRLVKTHSYTIAKAVLDNVYALVTNANYGAAALISTAANFDSDDVVDLRKTAVDAGWTPWLGNGAVNVLNPTYYAALLKDAAIKDYSSSQTDSLRSGRLPDLSGFDIVEAPVLPGNSENLVGFNATPDAIAIAMRPPRTQSQADFIAYEVMQDDVSGAVMVYAAVFNRQYRRVDHTFEVLHGAAKANTAALKRITSA
jgi:hypothetical protein